MKKNGYISLIIILFLFFFLPKLFGQLSPFATGLQKYRQGDLEGAIADFETVLTTDKENIKAKEYLLNCLIASATKFIQEKEYTKAITYLERASELSPEDNEIKQLYQTVKSKLAKGVITPKVIPPPAPAIPSPTPVVAPKTLPPEVPGVKETKTIVPPKIEKILEVRKEISPELEEKLTILLNTFEQERNVFQQYLTQQGGKEKRARTQFLILIISVLSLFTFVFLGSFSLLFKSLSRRKKFISPEVQKKILELREKEYQILLEQSEKRLTEIKEKYAQERNIFQQQLEEKNKQMEEEKEKLKLRFSEFQKFSETQLTEMKEKFLEEKNTLTKEFEKRIKQSQEEKEKMSQEILELQKINQELKNQIKEYLKEKKQREEELRIIFFPLLRQREDLLQYLRQWERRQKSETLFRSLQPVRL